MHKGKAKRSCIWQIVAHTNTHIHTHTHKIGEAFEKQAMRPPFRIVEMVIRDKLTIVLKA